MLPPRQGSLPHTRSTKRYTQRVVVPAPTLISVAFWCPSPICLCRCLFFFASISSGGPGGRPRGCPCGGCARWRVRWHLYLLPGHCCGPPGWDICPCHSVRATYCGGWHPSLHVGGLVPLGAVAGATRGCGRRAGLLGGHLRRRFLWSLVTLVPPRPLPNPPLPSPTRVTSSCCLTIPSPRPPWACSSS